MSRLAVVAVGGNSLTKPGQRGTIAEQIENARETATHMADMAGRGYDIVVTHGNGPQVGGILLRAEMAAHVVPPIPLDACVADTQGGMGYMLQQALGCELAARGIDRDVVTVVTQVVVDADDPAFNEATKPIGPFYTREEAERKRDEKGWKVVEDANRGWRRVVPSPMPRRIVEARSIERLLESGTIVIAVGGGGVPVVEEADGSLRGIEAVIDKDHASRLVGNSIGAELLLMSTAVEMVSLGFGTEDEVPLPRLSIGDARVYFGEGHFPPGSMGPKILAGVDFLENGGREVIITAPEAIGRALDGETGTHMTG
jgi:carbamate kinase